MDAQLVSPRSSRCPPSRRLAACLLLGAALLVALPGCGVVVRAVTGDEERAAAAAPPAPRPLTEAERQWAEAAWAYFRANQTLGQGPGLANSVAGYPSSTMWELGDMLAALVSARDIGLIDPPEFDRRVSPLLGFLAGMDLSFGRLPNKTYDARDGRMTRDGQPGHAGWSAVDTGRLLVWLRILAERHPAYAEYAGRAVSRLALCEAVGPDGGLMGAGPGGATPSRYPEASRGYGRYAAIGYRLWGIELAAQAPSGTAEVEGVALPLPAGDGVPLLSGPALLAGMEVGFGVAWPGAAEEAAALAEAQLRRTRAGTTTARTEFLRGSAPYFVFGTVAAGGEPWAVREPDGTPQPALALVSTRAAFGLWALFPDRMEPVRAAVEPLHDQGRGWFEGRYERTGAHEATLSASTNAQVLEALAYRMRGPALPGAKPPPGKRCGA